MAPKFTRHCMKTTSASLAAKALQRHQTAVYSKLSDHRQTHVGFPSKRVAKVSPNFQGIGQRKRETTLVFTHCCYAINSGWSQFLGQAPLQNKTAQQDDVIKE